ncbi:PLP-dependent aminotransferase family protein [Actinospica sp. MGRD01-02]|uniref:PLP-dependent aminotransferase family protein n=1 Tax=Actinospica acidithermotolerans TaxID=2828514 RepID=A0A941EA89_9ACTN|nr:PLP-dependent aminotransferase family protein [Actinospica acidithermotolerans]MBR7827841.1 PLP-dependent aminotransferase family protein [Actinospica acidithermotolerans]
MPDSSSTDSVIASLKRLLAQLSPGDKLPSSRDLVARHGVSPVTVSRAIAQLAAEGLVVTRPGAGSYVAARSTPARAGRADTSWQTVALAGRDIDTSAAVMPVEAQAVAPDGEISMAGGYLHAALQPTRALAAALARAARRPDAWHRAPAAGLAPLRAIFARMADPAGAVDAEDVLITGGGQGALALLFRALAAPGAPVLVESPTYPGALAAARAAGLRPVAVPMDAEGIRPDLLADVFAMTGARVLYCQPSLHNPTGTVLAAHRRDQTIAVTRAAGAFLIEDDFGRHLGHGRPLPRPLLTEDVDGTVVYLTSLTKPTAPSLRIGAVIARGPVMRRLQTLRYVDDFFTARPLQEAAIEMLSTPAWDRHLRTLATALRDRCATLSAAVATQLPAWRTAGYPAAGLHLWFELPDGLADGPAADAARTLGVAVNAGTRFFPAEPDGAFLRLGFAAAANEHELAEGVRRLARIGA